ncbi:hypothetical protein PDE_03066 [Penicillium oxalicum 114-2]|uniref:Uncharacterized protein n=1 Tax=Penicillium oxalicum (strain 114-2 / CGMCC 5302) TaxID=933388 RepID=S7ZBX5_PENO1|nr:hypothetical protein PDE_03066 [Penicillium oxalicum 114-2]
MNSILAMHVVMYIAHMPHARVECTAGSDEDRVWMRTLERGQLDNWTSHGIESRPVTSHSEVSSCMPLLYCQSGSSPDDTGFENRIETREEPINDLGDRGWLWNIDSTAAVSACYRECAGHLDLVGEHPFTGSTYAPGPDTNRPHAI